MDLLAAVCDHTLSLHRVPMQPPTSTLLSPGTRLLDDDTILRVLRFPGELNKDAETGRYEILANGFSITPKEEKGDGCISAWDALLTTQTEATAYSGREDRRFIVEMSVGAIRKQRLPGGASALFDVVRDPLVECRRSGPYVYVRPGHRGHCALSGLSLGFAESTLPPSPQPSKKKIKEQQRAIRTLLVDLAQASKHHPPSDETESEAA